MCFSPVPCGIGRPAWWAWQVPPGGGQVGRPLPLAQSVLGNRRHSSVFHLYIELEVIFCRFSTAMEVCFLQRVMRPVTHAGHLLALRVPCSRVSACFRAELTSQDRKQGFCALMTMATVPTLCPGPGSSRRWEVLQRSRVTGGARTQPPAVFNTFREHRLGQGGTSPPRPGGLRAGAAGRTAAWFSLPCPSGRFHLGLAEILFVRPPLQSFRKPLPILASRC